LFGHGQSDQLTTACGFERQLHAVRQPDSKAIYKRRKVIVEAVFGHIKNTGFRRFSVRGKEKVAGEFSLVCSAYNILASMGMTIVYLRSNLTKRYKK
jgi:hypothetical protein